MLSCFIEKGQETILPCKHRFQRSWILSPAEPSLRFSQTERPEAALQPWRSFQEPTCPSLSRPGMWPGRMVGRCDPGSWRRVQRGRAAPAPGILCDTCHVRPLFTTQEDQYAAPNCSLSVQLGAISYPLQSAGGTGAVCLPGRTGPLPQQGRLPPGSLPGHMPGAVQCPGTTPQTPVQRCCPGNPNPASLAVIFPK